MEATPDWVTYARCEVKAECLEFAVAEGLRFGVWGGKSQRERRRLRD